MKKAALLLLVLAVATPAQAKTKPPLRRACQLLSTAQVSAVMGRKMARTANDPTGCEQAPNQFLPGSGLGNEAWLDSCNSNLAFRLGRVDGELTAYSADVQEGSRKDSARATAMAHKAVKQLRKLRCPPSFCFGT